MLTCDICGEEIMLEEDMKTHLLLSHLENDMHCPLCSLSGVSYDELCFHISSAHPECTASSDCSAGTNTGVTGCSKPPTSQSCSASSSSGTTGVVATSSGASSCSTDSVHPHGLMPTLDRGEPTHVETVPVTSTLSSKTKQEGASACREHAAGTVSEHKKAKQKRLSSPGKGNSIFFSSYQTLRSLPEI